MLLLSRVGRAELKRTRVDLSALAQTVIDDLQRASPERRVSVHIQPGLTVQADGQLMHVALDNLLGNAWKFTAKVPDAHIEFGCEQGAESATFHVRDNGAGFNMSYVDKLFRPFSRLHKDSDFPGTGIGLATVQRVIDRHGGRVQAQGTPGGGATISFSLPTRKAGENT
jgi:signal transduction histidine kinase